MSTINFSLDELVIPATLDSGTGPDFVEMVEVRNRIETLVLGTNALNPTAGDLLTVYQSQVEELLRLFLIRVDGQIIGRAVMGWSPESGAHVTGINVEVVPAFRGHGIASSVLAQLEQLSADDGRYVIQSGPMHSPAEDPPHLAPPTGFGHLSMHDPGAKFLLSHGFALEQIERISFLDLPMDRQILAAHRSSALAHADGYRLHSWAGRTPERWRSDLAVLRSRMSTDAPSADLEIDELVWDVDRINAHDESYARSGTLVLTAAAEHVATGVLAGFTELSMGSADAEVARQMDTLVHADHRGHRLGMLLKVANLEALVESYPQVSLVTTFNAEENRPMLVVNEALGFRAAGRAAGWQKVLPH